MAEKQFKIDGDDLKPLIESIGACYASDRITVDGVPVGYMYRESVDFEEDSGWRFLAGDEDDAYMDNADNHDIYDVNTIANYDPDIIPHLGADIGAAFERHADTDEFQPVD